MNIKEEIYKIIITNCYTEEDKPEDSVIMGDNFEKLTDDLVKKLTIPVVTKRNWFEKLPLHWRLLYYFIGGIIIGLLLPYVW